MTLATAALAARAAGLTKTYGSGLAQVTALDGVSVQIPAGSFTAVMGPSGSGKSTMMHCMAGLDSVSGGRVWIGDEEISAMPERRLTRLRRDRIGFVFQAFNLLPVLAAAENITLPLDIAGRDADRDWLHAVSRPSASPTGSGTGPASCPAASSSASRSPARWSASPTLS